VTGPSLVTVDYTACEVLVNGQRIDCPTSAPIVTGHGFGQPGEVTITLYPDALTVHGEATATAAGDEETVDLGAAAVAREDDKDDRLSEIYDITHALEDEPSNIEAFEALGVKVVVGHGRPLWDEWK
jgi:hypothetical protein